MGRSGAWGYRVELGVIGVEPGVVGVEPWVVRDRKGRVRGSMDGGKDFRGDRESYGLNKGL